MVKYESLLEYKKQKKQLVVYSSIWLKKFNWIAKMTPIFLELQCQRNSDSKVDICF